HREKIAYQAFAERIAAGLVAAANKDESEWSISNDPAVDVILISKGYVLTTQSLQATGVVSPRLAKRLAANNSENDGVFLQLAHADRVVAFKALPLNIRLSEISL